LEFNVSNLDWRNPARLSPDSKSIVVSGIHLGKIMCCDPFPEQPKLLNLEPKTCTFKEVDPYLQYCNLIQMFVGYAFKRANILQSQDGLGRVFNSVYKTDYVQAWKPLLDERLHVDRLITIDNKSTQQLFDRFGQKSSVSAMSLVAREIMDLISLVLLSRNTPFCRIFAV
jgi:hypothetical protein